MTSMKSNLLPLVVDKNLSHQQGYMEFRNVEMFLQANDTENSFGTKLQRRKNKNMEQTFSL